MLPTAVLAKLSPSLSPGIRLSSGAESCQAHLSSRSSEPFYSWSEVPWGCGERSDLDLCMPLTNTQA